MYEFITLVILLFASVFFTEQWLRGENTPFLRLCIAVASAAIAYFAVSFVWKSGAFIAAMLIGQLACVLYDLIRGRGLLLCEICVYASGDTVWLPLCLCGDDVWQYAVYLAALVLCAALAPFNKKNEKSAAMKAGELPDETQKRYRLISCLPCAGVALDVTIIVCLKTVTTVSAISLCVAFLAVYALLLWLQMEIIRRANAEYLNGVMNEWQQESRDYMNTIRSQRHDFNLHLHAVSGLLRSGEYEECGQYVQRLVSEANDVNDIMPVSDAVVGSMLYNMREEARRRGSDILYHITYDMEDVLCNGFECNKIIGNLIQNAIDALQSDADRAYGIHVSIFKRGGNTVIISENRFSGDPNRIARVFESGYSTKKGHEGIGLSMVLRTVERYGGRIYPEFEEDRIRFVVNIPNKVRFTKGG